MQILKIDTEKMGSNNLYGYDVIKYSNDNPIFIVEGEDGRIKFYGRWRLCNTNREHIQHHLESLEAQGGLYLF